MGMLRAMPLRGRAGAAVQANKKAPEGAFVIVPLREGDIGAGEGIRTLDPNLGKVMLYP